MIGLNMCHCFKLINHILCKYFEMGDTLSLHETKKLSNIFDETRNKISFRDEKNVYITFHFRRNEIKFHFGVVRQKQLIKKCKQTRAK